MKTDRQAIVAEYRHGMSIRSVAKRCGVTPDHVRKVLKEEGVPRRPHTFARRRASFHPAGYVRWGKSYVHRIVCEAWHGPPPTTQHQVNHIDGDKTNNHPENLEWVTPLENARHAWRELGLTATRFEGEDHPRAKLTEADVRMLRSARARGEPMTPHAERLGVSLATACNAAKGKTWSHLPMPDPARCGRSQQGVPA